MSEFKKGDHVEFRGDRGVVVHVESCAGPNVVVRRASNGQIGIFFAGELTPGEPFEPKWRWVRVDRHGNVADYLYHAASDVPANDMAFYAVVLSAQRYAQLTKCQTCQGEGAVTRDDGHGGLVNDSCPDCTKAWL